MDYFFGFKSVISQPEAEPSPADTVIQLALINVNHLSAVVSLTVFFSDKQLWPVKFNGV